MALMDVNPGQRNRLSERLRWFALRMLQRLLVSGRGEVSALERALRLQERLLILALVTATVLPALIILVYLALSAVGRRSDDMGIRGEASTTAESARARVARRFEDMESRVLTRLQSGGSGLTELERLDPWMLVALELDESGRLVAPFRAETVPPSEDAALLVDESAESSAIPPAAGLSPDEAVRVLERALAEARGRVARGRAALALARGLAAARRVDDALALLDGFEEDIEPLRDAWGVRLGDLARLEAAELRLARDPETGEEALRALVESLLSETWRVGRGGEAAVARRALAMLPERPTGAAPDWTDSARRRLAERSRLLYWAEQLEPELDEVFRSFRRDRVPSGTAWWRVGDRALWFILRWESRVYAFALDWPRFREHVKVQTRDAVAAGKPFDATLVASGDPLPGDVLARAELDPWLTGQAIVVTSRAPYAAVIEEDDARRRKTLTAGAVFLAVLSIGFGVFFTARLVRRELELAELKTRFAANVSHELRSPITQIRLKGEALLFGLADTPEEQQQYYQAIVRESERLSRLIEDVLDYAVLPSGQKNLAPRIRLGSLTDTVRRAIDAVRSSEELKRMELDIQVPTDLPPVPHDADAVVRCIINLMSNAAKYSKDSNWIGVRARKVEGALEVVVSDRGIGIAPADLQRIFEPYFRSNDPRVGTRKGAGLGLTITQEIMKAHGGRVDAQSRPGRGSTFTLRFPLNPGVAPTRTA